jgi:hypothetical protein
LEIEQPPDWSVAWESVRYKTHGAVGDLRRALQSALPAADPV